MNDEELKALAMWYEQIDDEALVPDVSSDGHSETDSEYRNPVFDETDSDDDAERLNRSDRRPNFLITE